VPARAAGVVAGPATKQLVIGVEARHASQQLLPGGELPKRGNAGNK